MAREIVLRDYLPLLQMNKTDFECIITVLQQYKYHQADILAIICTLKNMGIITVRKFNQLFEENRGRNNVSLAEFILRIIPEVSLNFEQLCGVLDIANQKKIATKLRDEKYKHLYHKISRKIMIHTKMIHKFYKTQKSDLDNDCYVEGKPGKIKILRQHIANYDQIILSSDNKSIQELAVERKPTALVLLMQLYTDPAERRLILEQAVRTDSNGLDNTSLVIIFHSKMAVTEAFDGNKAAALDHITQAKILCESIAPCFVLISAMHDFLIVHKVLFSKEPTEEMLQNVLKHGENALLCLREMDKDVQIIWKRIILLLMVMSLLHITLDLEVERSFPNKKEKVVRAKELLKELEKDSDNMELRRQMVTYFCHGIIMEDEDINAAKVYIQAAEDKAREGGCFHTSELHNIEQYRAQLNARIQAHTAATYM